MKAAWLQNATCCKPSTDQARLPTNSPCSLRTYRILSHGTDLWFALFSLRKKKTLHRGLSERLEHVGEVISDLFLSGVINFQPLDGFKFADIRLLDYW